MSKWLWGVVFMMGCSGSCNRDDANALAVPGAICDSIFCLKQDTLYTCSPVTSWGTFTSTCSVFGKVVHADPGPTQ